MNQQTRARIVILAAVTTMALVTWLGAAQQRSASDRGTERMNLNQALLVGMLDQETGARGFLLTGDPRFLEPYDNGRRQMARSYGELEANLAETDETSTSTSIDRQRVTSARWQALAIQRISAARAAPLAARRIKIEEAVRAKAYMEAFRSANQAAAITLRADDQADQRRAATRGVLGTVMVGIIFVVLGHLIVGRSARRQVRHRELQRQYADCLKGARDEDEAYGLVKRHLETTVPNCEVVVINRNNSADRLEPWTAVDPTSPLAVGLRAAEPATCLAIRSGRTHLRRRGQRELLTCKVCGQTAEDTSCVPSLVGGEVIGAVLAVHHSRPRAEHVEHIEDNVAEATPMVANLRNLAVAERRASTDSLTGLPNARAMQESMRRLVAEAGRHLRPLSCLMLDLDHFKEINDTLGHARGDDVLAAVGSLIGATVRGQDLPVRYGGEEFVLLLPETDFDGALLLAEKLRAAIEGLRVPGVERDVTASLGVATMPEHAKTADELLRAADRALYAAKRSGRNRICAFDREHLDLAEAGPR